MSSSDYKKEFLMTGNKDKVKGKDFLGSIKVKLLVTFLSISFLTLLIGLLAILQLNQVAAPINKEWIPTIYQVNQTSTLDGLAQFIRYYDEVLTQSARNYAFTGDLKWKERYELVVPELDILINDAIEGGDKRDAQFFSSVDDANIALVQMEEDAIRLVDSGQADLAINILESDNYWDQKKFYEEGLRSYVSRRGAVYDEALTLSTQTLEFASESTLQLIKKSAFFVLVLIFIAFLFSLGFGVFLFRSIVNPLRQLQIATEAFAKGDFSTRISITTGDEFEQLGNMFNKTAKALARIDQEHKQIDQAKTRFLSITSHELRSPMTPMKAQLQMLDKGYFGKLNEKQKKSLETVLRNTDRLDKIIVDFLEVSRIEAARLKFTFKKIRLNKAIRELVNYMKGFMPEKNVSIEMNLGKLPVIEVDPDRVSQVLRNLISNAIKFSKNGGAILVSAHPRKDHILFSIEDNGIGMDQRDQLRVFEPFFQAEQTIYRSRQGTGLGLAICKGLVESQNGKIWLESDLNRGTAVYFTVPFKPVHTIKPITLLFSPKQEISSKVRELLLSVLGPMGDAEFTTLDHQGLTYQRVRAYMQEIHQYKIIDEDTLLFLEQELSSFYQVKNYSKKS